jgi:hypothetical protein
VASNSPRPSKRRVFTAKQRRSLQDLELLAEQIAELEIHLPLLHAVRRPPATMADVRSKLLAAKRQLGKIVSPSSEAAREARTRILQADFEVFEFAEDSVQRAFDSVTAALGLLPTDQRRGGGANPWLIYRIEKALLDGFLKHHNPRYPQIGKRALPPYRLRTSRTGRFAEIAAICFEAAGFPPKDTPDKAIREHLRLQQLRRTRLRDSG